MLLIYILSLANKFIFGQDILCTKDYYGYFYMFPFLVVTGLVIFDKRLFKALIVMTALESIIGLGEYVTGVRSFFLEADPLNVIKDYSLLYNSRVFGLSVNSSILAYKVFLAFILIDFVHFKRYFAWILRIALTLGLFLSFSRVIVILVLLYWLLNSISMLRLGFRRALQESSFLFMAGLLCLNLIFIVQLKDQLTRGGHDAESSFAGATTFEEPEPQTCADKHAIPMKPGTMIETEQGLGDRIFMSAENIQSSGRKQIWLNYINFSEKHLLFGNGSDKLMLRRWLSLQGKFKLVHAHNSYLQLLASNGIIISLLYFLFYFAFWKTKNYLPILIIALYSFANYGIFWGFSYMDLIFIILLSTNLTRVYDNERTS